MQPLKSNWTKQIATFFLLSNLFGCSSVPRPVGKEGVVHTAGLPAGVAPYINYFDFQKDFDDSGHVTGTGTKSPLNSLGDLNKNICLDAQSYANLLAYGQKIYDRYKNCEAGQ